MSVSLKQVSGNLKHAPAQGEISESAMKVKDALEDIIGDRAHVVISDSMKTSADGTKGTRAFLDPETGVFYVNNKFKFDEKFTELATAIHELYHAAEGTKQSAELHRALGEFVQAFPEVSDQLTGGVEGIKANAFENYRDEKLNAMQQGYVNATEIDADILGKLLGSEEYVAKLAVRNENLVKKLYTYLKAAGKSTQSKQVRRALDKLTKKFGNALDHAKGGVLVSQIGDEEEKENTPEGVNIRKSISGAEEIIDLSLNNELSDVIKEMRGAPKYKAIANYILDVLGGENIELSDGKMAIVDKSDALHIANKSGSEKTAQISKIKEIVQKATLYAEDTNVEHNKFNYFCYYKAKVKYQEDIYSIYINVGKGKNDDKYHIYDITKKIRDTAHRVNDVERPKPNEGYALENGISNNRIPQSKSVVNSNSTQNSEKDASNSKKSSSGINDRRSYAGVRADTADHSLLSKAQEMLDEGYDSETVRKETGWFKGYDGKWRFEIDDFDSSLIENPNLTRHEDDGEVYFTGKLTDIFDHPELYKAYPQLKDINIVIQKTDFGVDAIYLPDSNYITLSREHFKRYTKEYYDYLNGGRKSEVEKIEQTPEFLEYNKWYDDEIADNTDAVEWLKGELEARQKFFSSELGKRYHQLKYSKDGFTGEKFELGWGKEGKAVILHELQHAIQNIEGFATGTNTRDTNYNRNSGEIEAFDTGRRADLTAEQRKNTRPDIDREDVIVSNKNAPSFKVKRDSKGNQYWYIETGKDIFKNISEKDKLRDAAYNLIINNRDHQVVYEDMDGRKIEFIRLSAEEFTFSEESKSLYTDDPEIFKKKMRMAPSIDDLITYSAVNWTSPDHKNHKLYKEKGFINYRGKVRIDNVIFNYVIRVGQANKFNGFHDINLEVAEYLPHTAKNSASDMNKATSINSIPQNSDLSTKKSNINERSSKTGKDTVEMSRGEIEKLRANYQSEKVFDKKGVSDALNGIPMFKKLPSDVRGKLIESIWTGFNEHRAYDKYIEVMTERLYATIMQETDFELYELDVDESKSAEKRR